MGISKQVGEFNTQATKIDVVAMEMGTGKSTVSKFQNKRVGDASIRKFKRYIEAIGGEFSAQVTFPDGTVVEI
tara:strand:- start:9059 stop:9277 length:219 start_codon:yes stop_codon:yes gene_type:complete